jgi:hypothetical protein
MLEILNPKNPETPPVLELKYPKATLPGNCESGEKRGLRTFTHKTLRRANRLVQLKDLFKNS